MNALGGFLLGALFTVAVILVGVLVGRYQAAANILADPVLNERLQADPSIAELAALLKELRGETPRQLAPPNR